MRRLFSGRIRSFRARIALLSTLLSGVVLAGFMGWTWRVVQGIDLHRMDEDIREIGGAQLSAPRPPERWGEVAKALQFTLGSEAQQPFILLVKDRDGSVLYQSPNWPAEFSADEFAAAKAGDGARGPAATPPGPAPVRLGPPRPRLRGPGWRRGPPPGFGPPPPPPRLAVTELVAFTRPAHGIQWRIGVMANRDVTFVLGLNMSRFNNELHRLRDAFLIAAPAALLGIAAAGWWISQRALRPVRILTATAERITAKGLDQRIASEQQAAEFERLTLVFNRMLDRLEGSFQQAVRFSADAAHELKTPLTILQGELEQAIQEAPTGSRQQQTLNTLLEEVERLRNIIRKLLLLSLADSGQLRLNVERVNLTETLEAACEDISILRPELSVLKRIAPDQQVMADPDLIRQVIQNLVNNAVKYNRPGGFIRIDLGTERSVLKCRIANSGRGIPVADRAKVFERFYRGDKARTRAVDGVGLGLSLAREIARAHQGDIVLENAPEGETVFTLILPAAGGP